MFKLTFVLLAALAFQCALTDGSYEHEHYHPHEYYKHRHYHPHEHYEHEHRDHEHNELEQHEHEHQQHHRDTQELLEHVRSVSHDAVNALQHVEVGDHQLRHILGHEAHELAHNVHEIAYHLQQIIYHNYNGQDQETLAEIIRNLYDIVHGIQKALRHGPTEFQTLLRVQIENLVVEAGKLGTVAQQPQGSEEINNQLLVVLDDLLVAMQQFHVRSKLRSQNQQDIKINVQTVGDQVSNSIQHVDVRDKHVIHRLVHYCHHLAHHLGDVIRKLERESHHYKGDIRDVLRQVVNKFSEIRRNLEQAEHETSIEHLQTQLKACVHDIATQVQRLVTVAHSSKLDEHESRNLKNVVHSILAHTLAAERQLQRSIQHLFRHHQKN